MADNSFSCSECGHRISVGQSAPGAYVQCSHCQALVGVSNLAERRLASTPTVPFQVRETKRTVPLWVYFGLVIVLCVLALGVIFWVMQSGRRDQAAFMDALQLAEKAEMPADGLRIIEQVLVQSRFDEGQKSQARAMRLLLQKRMQVDAAVAAAKREEAVRLAAAAAKPQPVQPAPLPELTLADAQTAFEKGLALACGPGGTNNAEAALAWIHKAAVIGLPEAQHDLSAMYAEGIGCTTNLLEALLWGRKAAEQGDAEAQAWLGYVFASAKGVPADPVQAAQWNQKAAAQGHTVAALNLGIQYVNGQGVRQDCALAFSQFNAAAARGNAEAQVNLGTLYWKGVGVAQDATNAFRFFKKAQDLGSVQGTFAMGLLYGIGAGVAKDRQLSYACCLSAARSGHAGAQKQLGRMFMSGTGVSWSEQDAIYWYRLAAAQGDESARLAVEAYRNTHLPPVFATCETCVGKGVIVRTCIECRGAGAHTETLAGKSVKNCTCGWQMINGHCPNCGKVDSTPARSISVTCAVCRGSGRQSVACERCGGSGQVRVAGAAQATFAQMVSRTDPGITLSIATTYTPVRLHPFRTGVNRGLGL